MKNGKSELTQNNVVSMRSDYLVKEKTLKDIADEYDTHYNTARNVIHRCTWKDLSLAK